MSKEINIQGIFYGWFVVAACFAATFTLGEAMWTFGVFFKPLEDEFGWSRALISSSYTSFSISYGISVMICGRLADKYNPRPILLVSGLLAGLGTSLCGQVHSITQLHIFLFIAGLGGGATWSVPTSTVQRWFYHRQGAGLALGLVVAGVGVGGLIFAPLISYLIFSYGWRTTYLIVGIFYLTVIGTSSLAIRKAPAEVRLASGEAKDMSNSVNKHGWKVDKVMTTTSFAGINLVYCIGVVAFQTVSVHLIPHATDVGFCRTASAAALGFLGGFSVPGRIITGLISDSIDWQRLLALSYFGLALSMLFLLFLKGAGMLYCFVFLFGICHGSRISSHLGILGEFFGMRSLGSLIGITAAISIFIGAFAPYIAGFLFDTTGSYSLVFIILMILLFSGGIIASVIKKPVASE